MHETIDIFTDEEEATPEWAIELQKQHREAMEKIQNERNKIKNQLDEVEQGIKTTNELLRSYNLFMKSENDKLQSAKLKRKLALKEMKKIQAKIAETKAKRAEIEKYWDDLIEKEIEKRSTCRYHQSRKSSRKRLNNNDEDYKPSQRKIKRRL